MDTCIRCGRPVYSAQWEIDGQAIHSACRTYKDAWHVEKRSPEVVRLRAEVARLRTGLLAIGREARDGNTLAHVGLIVGLDDPEYKAVLREVSARGRGA